MWLFCVILSQGSIGSRDSKDFRSFCGGVGGDGLTKIAASGLQAAEQDYNQQ